RQPNFALLLVAVWLFGLVQAVAGAWNLSGAKLIDGDDALRLLQVRDFLAGQAWFDLHQPRLGLSGYDSHWSRLIDAPLAGFVRFFGRFVDGNAAEALTTIIWPPLWLLPTMGGAAAIAWRIGGRAAAIVALLLCVFSLPGVQQFAPGRIDHHNVQIALAVLTIAATVWADRVPWAAYAAGLVSALALAIGLEGLPFFALGAAAFGLRYVFEPTTATALRDYGISLAAGCTAAFLVSVGPEHWTRSVCDEIAINFAVAAVAGGAGLAAASRLADRRFAVRLAAVAGAGAVALALFVLFEPRCLAGPYGLVDPGVAPILFAEVAEMQSLPGLLRGDIAAGVATVAFPAAGLLAGLMLALGTRRNPDPAVWIAAAACLVACAVTFDAFRGYPYALWLSVPLVAAAALDLCRRIGINGLLPRFAALLLVTPVAISLGAMSIAAAATGSSHMFKDVTVDRRACVNKDSYTRLAQLPKGRVVANELEWGSYLLLWTPHSVVGAPYHRLSEGIALTHRLFASPPDEARKILARVRADYLVACGPRGFAGMRDDQRAASLWNALRAGKVPPWLKVVAGTEREPFTVYRVKR
ncbi:MAG TPA: hypothetical protein VN930_11525, partial [Xanthobacteraceae bacterium]|nr:hypothetical protein [Xanthobacteraceae bacterium]